MATNARDVKMTLSVESLGEEGIKALQDSVAKLAKEGGAAAPEFQQLADEIGRLGDQAAALRAVETLGEKTGTLAARQEAAATSASDLSTRLDALKANTLGAVEAQRKIAAELDAAEGAARKTRDALALLTLQTAEAKKADEEYATKVVDSKKAKIEQRAEVERLSAALSASNAAVKDAEGAEKLLAVAYGRAEKAANTAAAAATAHQAALRESAAAAEALGVSTTDVAASQTQLISALNRIGQQADEAQASVERLAQRERELIEIRAFEKMADDAKRIVETSRLTDVFDEALRRAAESARQFKAAQEAINWQSEAEGIVNAAEAAQRLNRQEEILLATQKEIAAQRAFEKQAADARNLVKAADYVQFWETELSKAELQVQQTAEAAQAAGRKIADAFSTIGVRSAQDLQAEISRVRAALAQVEATAGLTGAQLRTTFNAGNAKIKELERDLRSVNGVLTAGDRAAALFKNSLGQIAAGNVIADGIGYLVNKVKEMGTAFVDVVMKTETVRLGLQAVYKSTTIAAEQFQFMRDTANKAGVSITSINDAFLRFSAATKSANIPLSVTNDLFAAVTQAGATLGLTGEQVTGTLDALGQMASKGVVSMEELRQQLGDRLPGALSLAATGLGITDVQLIKLVESGKLATEDFFPAFAAGLKTMSGDTNTLTGAWQRFTNALNEGAVAASDAGGLTLLKVAVQGLAVVFGLVAVPLQGFVEGLRLAGLGVFALVERMRGNKKAFEDYTAEVEKSAARITKLHQAVELAVNGQEKQLPVLQQSADGHQRLTGAVINSALAQERLAAGAGAATSTYVQQLVKLAENTKAVDVSITASEKLLRAKQEEGKAVELTAKITGDASKALDANSLATTENFRASEQIVTARQAEVANTQALITTINAQRDATGQLSSAKQKQLLDATQSLEVQTAELEKSQATTFELSRQALAAQVAADAYADNSEKLQAYGNTMLFAQATAASLTATLAAQKEWLALIGGEMAAGRATAEQYAQATKMVEDTTESLNRATGEAAKFEALHRDAVRDSVAALDLKARAASASIGVTLAQANAEGKHYEALARAASLQGNEAQATEFRVLAKYREIEAVRLSAHVKNLELDADKAGIEVQLAALDPADRLYEQKRKELEIRLEIIKAKRIEANASRDVIDGINAEIAAIQNRNNAATRGASGPPPGGGSGGGSGGGFGGGGRSSYSGSTNYSNGRPDDPNNPNNFIGSDGLPRRKSDGAAVGTFNNTVPLDLAKAVADNVGRVTYSAADIPMLEQAFQQALDAQQFIGATSRQSAGAVSLAAFSDTRGMVTSTKSALEQARRSEAGAARGAAAASAPAEAAGTSHTVTINVGGVPTTISTASPQDSSALVGVLSQLGNAKKVF